MELDQDTLERLIRYCGRDPREPEVVTREAYHESGTRYWTPAEFLAEITAAIESIPPERRADASVEFVGDYDEWGHLKITYEDMQTPAEVQEHLERCLGNIREEQRRERETFERLRVKYG